MFKVKATVIDTFVSGFDETKIEFPSFFYRLRQYDEIISKFN